MATQGQHLQQLGLRSIRLRVDEGLGLWCRFVRVDGLCSALGLEPEFRRGLGLGVGFKVQFNKTGARARL